MLTRPLSIGLFLLVLHLTHAGTASQSVAPQLTDADIEQFLKSARVVSSRGAGKGVTDSTRATLSDGTRTHDAHIQTVQEFKSVFRGGSQSEMNFRDNWQFNVAAYRIDRLIGLRQVPVSVDRTWNGRGAAFTWWVDDVLMDEEQRIKKKVDPPNPRCWVEHMWGVRLFDQLIDNADRNMGNIVITRNWQLWAIDHTRAFRYARAPRDPSLAPRVDRTLLKGLKALDFQTLKREIGQYIDDADIRAILSRRDGLVAYFEKLGESSLFDRTDPEAGCK
jgi:hypothetical protein